MASNFHYLLIGNTRLHWAINVGDQYKFNHSKIDNPLSNKININNLIWASVGNYDTNIFKKENELKIEDINLKNFPSYFGIDRALASFAALKIAKNPFKKNMVIADFGTTLSITKINSDGELIGGQIIPGFQTQLKSMVLNTRNLEMPNDFKIPKDNFLIDTQKAMIKGVINSLFGAVKLAFNQDEDILIICGGDTEIITPNFLKETQILINPNLVMEGMVIYYEKRLNFKR